MKIRLLEAILGLTVLLCTTVHAGSYTELSNGMVRDNGTGLIWQKCSGGQSATDCSGTAALYTWEQALTYCESLSHGGSTAWRLPQIKELRSLADTSRYNPAINTTYFPGTISDYYWSSTTHIDFTTYAFRVSFGYAGTHEFYKTGQFYVRCVR